MRGRILGKRLSALCGAGLILCCLAQIPSLAEEDPEENERGRFIYDQRGCALCHDLTKDQRTLGLGPSWAQIGTAYKGSGDELSNFLRGEGEPKIKGNGDPKADQARHLLMHGQIVRLKTLSESERKALETFLMESRIKD